MCAKLIRIPSENPPGDTTRLVLFYGMGGPDEFIEEEELMQVARVHVATIFDYLGVA